MNTIEKLNLLAELREQRTALDEHYTELRQALIPPEIKQALEDVDAEKSGLVSGLDAKIGALEAEIKTDVLLRGETIKGDRIQAIYNKGRVSWDVAALDGYAAAHPEIAQFRKEGEPSVSIRNVK